MMVFLLSFFLLDYSGYTEPKVSISLYLSPTPRPESAPESPKARSPAQVVIKNSSNQGTDAIPA